MSSTEMQEAVGAASEAKGQADEAKGIFSKLRNNEVAQSADLLTAPVAGPPLCRITFLVAAVGCMFWGVWSVYQSGARTWKDPITSLTIESVRNISLPDIYLCLRAKDMRTLKASPDKKMFLGAYGDSYAGGAIITEIADVRTKCGSAATLIKTIEGTTRTKENMCVFEQVKFAPPVTATDLPDGQMNLGCLPAYTHAQDCPANKVVIKKDSVNAAALQKALPKYTHDGITYEAGCMEYTAKKGILLDTLDGHEISMTVATSERGETFFFSPVYEFFITDPGVSPVNAAGEILGARGNFGGPGMKSLADVSMQKIKDETKGDKTFKTAYQSQMWTKVIKDSRKIGGQLTLISG